MRTLAQRVARAREEDQQSPAVRSEDSDSTQLAGENKY